MTTTDRLMAELPPAADPTAASGDVLFEHPEPDAGPGSRRLLTLLLAAAAYLVVSVTVWWNVWSTHPTSTTTCGCGDTSLFTWFLEWPAYAISHGLNPLYSTAMFHPSGVNLLANTSELAIGVVLAPVTWLLGPVATLNVAVTLAPVLSALAMFVLLRRWVSWAPAAFVGGLFYGFSPFILVSLIDGHLMIGMAVVPPLVVLCLDELLFRQRRRPVVTGVLLGLLLVLQFFIGTEVLVIMVIGAAIGIALVVAYGVRQPEAFRRRAHYATVGLAAGGITAVVLLAYPVWFALAGPAHTSGPVWPNINLGYKGTLLQNFVLSPAAPTGLTRLAHRGGGYQGTTQSEPYLGFGVVAVLLGGMVVWRRDRRLWLFGAMTVGWVLLSLGANPRHWLPWQTMASLPLLENIIPTRFLAITYVAVAVMVGLIVDHTHAAVSRQTRAAPEGFPAHRATGPWPPSRQWAGAVAGLIVAGLAFVPTATYLAASTPITTQPVVLPTWFRTVAPHLDGHQVLLVFPVPYQLIESAMTWQAVDGMRYSMVGGGGPGGVLARAGKERKGQAIIGKASFSFSPQSIAPGDVSAIRQALDGWGVTMVVIPDQSDLPAYDRVTSVPIAVGLITAATGEAPIRQAGAWVWTGVDHAGPSASPTVASLTQCVAGAVAGSVSSITGEASCALTAASMEP